MSRLVVSDLRVSHGRGRHAIEVVAGVSLTVEPGQIVGLVGESGCGKSTLARTAVGLHAPTAGSVEFDGAPVPPLGRRARAERLLPLQMVFQNPYACLNPRRRIGDQIADGVRGADDPTRRVDELLEVVGLDAAMRTRFPHQFSGGQRQRIAIAAALAAQPDVVLLDEPFASLDASGQAQLANLLTRLSRELGVGMLLISHDLGIVQQIADVLYVMYLGAIVESGPTHALWREPHHPYTRALIGAIPHPDGAGTIPEVLPGDVGNPRTPPSGCRFHPRCPFAVQACTQEPPPLAEVLPGRSAACWRHEAVAGASAAAEVADPAHELQPQPRLAPTPSIARDDA